MSFSGEEITCPVTQLRCFSQQSCIEFQRQQGLGAISLPIETPVGTIVMETEKADLRALNRVIGAQDCLTLTIRHLHLIAYSDRVMRTDKVRAAAKVVASGLIVLQDKDY